MKKIDVQDKSQIKQLLYSNCVLAIKNDQCRSFGGFQLWWYDKRRDVCNCCESYWSDLRKRLAQYSLNQAARILWRKRACLFVRGKRLAEDRKLETVRHFYN
jgi:hypothetical protein